MKNLVLTKVCFILILGEVSCFEGLFVIIPKVIFYLTGNPTFREGAFVVFFKLIFLGCPYIHSSFLPMKVVDSIQKKGKALFLL